MMYEQCGDFVYIVESSSATASDDDDTAFRKVVVLLYHVWAWQLRRRAMVNSVLHNFVCLSVRRRGRSAPSLLIGSGSIRHVSSKRRGALWWASGVSESWESVELSKLDH
jgi:hypothetical protein